MLHMVNPDPMPSCSKAPRGLSVLLQVPGIFTGSVISPSPSLRQFSSRYAIRAGRNLHGKEFRSYLLQHMFLCDEVISASLSMSP